VTVAERDALIEILHQLVRHAFKHSGDATKAELLEVWRESYEVLCANGACSVDSPEARQ
jgi:ABC-type transporter Mla MlaB component